MKLTSFVPQGASDDSRSPPPPLVQLFAWTFFVVVTIFGAWLECR